MQLKSNDEGIKVCDGVFARYKYQILKEIYSDANESIHFLNSNIFLVFTLIRHELFSLKRDQCDMMKLPIGTLD